MAVLTAHCAHYTLPPELVSNVFERHGCRLYVASLLGRIVGGWAANRQLFWLFFPGLVEAVSASTRTTGLKTALRTAKPSRISEAPPGVNGAQSFGTNCIVVIGLKDEGVTLPML
jgi:hypothetical protein